MKTFPLTLLCRLHSILVGFIDWVKDERIFLPNGSKSIIQMLDPGSNVVPSNQSILECGLCLQIQARVQWTGHIMLVRDTFFVSFGTGFIEDFTDAVWVMLISVIRRASHPDTQMFCYRRGGRFFGDERDVFTLIANH